MCTAHARGHLPARSRPSPRHLAWAATVLAALAATAAAQPAADEAARLREQDRKAEQFMLQLQHGNDWPGLPDAAAIAAAEAAIPPRIVDGPDAYFGRTAVTMREGIAARKVNVRGADLAALGIHANQVVVTFTERTVTTIPARLGHEATVTESTMYGLAKLAWQEDRFTFGPVSARFDRSAARDAELAVYDDGWLTPDDEQVIVEGFDGTDGVHAPFLFHVRVVKDGAPLPDRLVGLELREGAEGMQRRVGWFAPAGLVPVDFDEQAGTSLLRPIKTDARGEVWLRLYADLGALGTATAVPRTVTLEAWVPRQASEGKTDRPARFSGSARVTVRHPLFVRGVRLQLGELTMRYPDTPMGTWEVIEDRMLTPWLPLSRLTDEARRAILAGVTLDRVPLALPDQTYLPVAGGALLLIDLRGHHREHLGVLGATPPARDAGAEFYPQRGDKVGVAVEWLDGTVAMFVARSRIRGPSALAVKLAPGPVAYGAGSKLAYFIGVESIQFGVEVIVERLLLGATGVPGFVAQVGYLVYQYADKTSDAAELLSIAAGDGTFVVLNSVIAHHPRETGGSELYTLAGEPALERADGSQVAVPAGHLVTFTAGADVGEPVATPTPAWAEAGNVAVRELPRSEAGAAVAADAIPGIEPIGAPAEPPAVAIAPADTAPAATAPGDQPADRPPAGPPPASDGLDAGAIAGAIAASAFGVLALVIGATLLRRRRLAHR